VGFAEECFLVADRSVKSIVREWWVSSEIWQWKLGVGEKASLPVCGDLTRDRGWVVEARVWVGVFSSPVREYQSKRLKLYYIISCFVCLIRCLKKKQL
jgi:hypothetical protein